MSWPRVFRIPINESLEVAQLMSQTNLSLLCRSHELSGEAIADPDCNPMSIHHIADDVHTAIETNDMQHGSGRTKDPLPPVISSHSAAGLIAINHHALLDLSLDRTDLPQGTLPSSLHDLVNPALADLHTMQVLDRRHGSLVTQMLLLPVVNNRAFEPHTKRAVHLQSSWGLANLFHSAARTHRTILAYLDDLCLSFRQFGDLVYIHQFLRLPAQIGLTMLTHIHFHIHNLIRISHKLSFVFLMTERRSVSMSFPFRTQVALLIPRRRLRRITRIGRRLLVLLQLQAQCFILCFQRFNLLRLRQNQLDQFFVLQLGQLALSHDDPSYQISLTSRRV